MNIKDIGSVRGECRYCKFLRIFYHGDDNGRVKLSYSCLKFCGQDGSSSTLDEADLYRINCPEWRNKNDN